MPPTSSHRYIAVLVRLWQEGAGVWRGTVENAHSGEVYPLADLHQLVRFIEAQTGEQLLLPPNDEPKKE